MYVQWRWEDFFWTSVEKAVDRGRKEKKAAKAAQKSQPHTPDTSPKPSRPQSVTPTPRILMQVPTEEQSLLRNPPRNLSSPESALTESRREYGHLDEVHELNIRSPGSKTLDLQAQRSPRLDGTVSRLEIGRSELERLSTKDDSSKHSSAPRQNLAMLCGLPIAGLGL